MRISQRRVYPKENSKYDNSYLFLMDTIKTLFSVSKIKEITRVKEKYTELAYEIRTTKRSSCELVIDYLSNYPLFSYPSSFLTVKMTRGGPEAPVACDGREF